MQFSPPFVRVIKRVIERWIRVYAGVAREGLICPHATEPSCRRFSPRGFRVGVMQRGTTPRFGPFLQT